MAVLTLLGFLLAPFIGGARAFWIVAPLYLCQVRVFFGIRCMLDGWEDLPQAIRDGKQAAIFVGNHTSLLDPPLVIATLPSRPVFLVKKELAYVPVLGWIIWLAGFIFIDRSHRSRALAGLKDAARRIREGQSLAAFPEGTRSRDGRLLPFKKGAFALAMESGVPVVPLGIQGGAAVLPKGTWRVAPATYHLRVGTPLYPGDFANLELLRDASAEAVARLTMKDDELLKGRP
jgi:1-acyl-sn-glycerol-3-phosphate acyltransferase